MKQRADRRRAIRIGAFAAAPLVVLMLIIHGLWYRPLDTATVVEAAVQVPSGASLRATSIMLEQRGMVASGKRLEWLGRLTGKANKIRPGEYLLSSAMSPAKILDKLVSGDVILYPVTIPEGFSVMEIIARLEEAGLGDADAFLDVLEDRELAERYGVVTDNVKIPFEGYLFPDTYYFARGTAPKAIIETMVKRLQPVFTPERLARMEEFGWNRHQTLTMASIIEKETGIPEERARISAVFHNRLARRMRLQTDPTVIYSIPDYDGNIRARDLRRDHPYNTYRRGGLPPGPIASPGEDAIQAALFPAADTALYFVARGDGSHVFSDTAEEHNQAVHDYLRHLRTMRLQSRN